MKLFRILLILTAPLMMFSCNSNTPQNQQDIEPVQLTPEVLVEESESSYSLTSKRTYEDVIMKLYNEALEKNPALAALDLAIQDMPRMKYDSIQSYQKYNGTNINYYNVALQYANQISDSITKRATVQLFSNLETQYKHSISKYNTLISMVESHQQELQDQLILMQLFVTQPMMVNYQKNELPNINQLENLLNQYRKLLKASKEYSK